MNPLHGSVTLLVRRAETGDEAAFEDLLARYMPRLLELARSFQLARHSTSASGSDYVNVTCIKLWCAIVRGRLKTIDNRDNLWRLMSKMTKNEAASHARTELALKRGGGQVVNESGVPAAVMQSSVPVRQMPTVEVRKSMAAPAQQSFNAASLSESGHDFACLEALESLPPDLQEIATLALIGERKDQIAATIGCAGRTVDRKLRLIRKYLSE